MTQDEIELILTYLPRTVSTISRTIAILDARLTALERSLNSEDKPR